MEKMWDFLENHAQSPETTLVDIFLNIVYKPTYTLGDIRSEFDKWTIDDLQEAKERMEFAITMEMDGSFDEEGDRDVQAFCERREAYIIHHLREFVWSTTKGNKKFF